MRIHASTAEYKRGSQLPQAKLTEEDVANIRALIRHRDALLAEAKTLRNVDLAEKFGVARATIDKIAYCGGWGHVA
jgi:hypothetical protein